MSEHSKIEWCDATFNPWIGCTKVSPACDHCYAERSTPARALHVQWGAKATRRRTTAANWRYPLRWNALHTEFFARHGRRRRVFCASLADVFDNQVSDDWRADLFELIATTPNLDWLLLTKRIGNVAAMVPYDWTCLRRGWPANVWLGATVVNQQEADRDIPKLLEIPARVRFLSMEPLLGPVSFEGMWASNDNRDHTNAVEELSWVIVGGESGPDARPMHPQWARDIRDQCAELKVPFFFKQHGEWVPRSACYHRFSDGSSCSDMDPRCKRWPYVVRLTEAGHDGSRLEHVDGGCDTYMQKVGKAFAGRLLDGRTHDEFPETSS